TAETPERLDHDAYDDGLDSVELARRRGHGAEPDVGPGERAHDERSGQDETHTGDDQPRPAAPSVADVNRHFRRVWSGNQIRRAQVVEELLAREPAAAPHDLVLHHGDVRRGTAEGDGAELEKQKRQLAERGAHRMTHSLRGPATATDGDAVSTLIVGTIPRREAACGLGSD